MVQYTKKSTYQWFQDVSGWRRLDFLCSLINLCNPFELRFIGSFIEDLARNDYNSLRDQDIKANNADNMSLLAEKPGNEFRSHLIVCLALLQSSNYRVAEKLSRILDDHFKEVSFEKLLSSGRLDEEEERMLMLTMASYHPAFSFEKKLLFTEKKEEFERMMDHRKNQRYGRYCRSVGQCPPQRYNTVNQEMRTNHLAYGPCQPISYISYPPMEYAFVNWTGGQYANSPVLYPNTLSTPGIPGKVPETYTISSERPKSREQNQELSGGQNDKLGALSDEDIDQYSSLSGDCPPPGVICVQAMNASHPTVTRNNPGSHGTCCTNTPHGVRTLPSPCSYVTSAGGHSRPSSMYVPVFSTSSSTASGKKSLKCQRKEILHNLEAGDVSRHGGLGRDKTNTPKSISYFKREVNNNAVTRVTNSTKLQKSKHNFAKNEAADMLVPVRVSDIHFRQMDNNVLSSRKKTNKCTMKVTWKDGKTTDCDKTMEELEDFIQTHKNLIRTKTPNLFTKHHNQVHERRKKIEMCFNELLSSLLSSSTIDRDSQSSIVSFFSRSPGTVSSTSELSLPLKKRKLKTESRSRSRVELDSSSSSTASPPLPTVRDRILSPGANRPLSSLSPQLTVNSISGSSALSSPSSSVNCLNSPVDDDDPQNDPYLKVRTDSQFPELDASEVDSISGLSAGDKKILKMEISNMKSVTAAKSTSLDGDMGRLSLGPKVPEIRDIVDSASLSRSEDEKSSSGRVPVEFETSDEAMNGSLQAVASNSCFSFEFDSSSAASGKAGDSFQRGVPTSEANCRRFSADTQGVRQQRNLVSPVEYSRPKVGVQSAYMSSTSAPPLSHLTYHPKRNPPRSHSSEQYMGTRGQNPPYQPYTHPSTLPLFSNQGIGPTTNSTPIYPMSSPSTLPAPIVGKQFLLSYIPTNPSCIPPAGEFPMKSDESNPTPAGTTYKISKDPVYGSVVMPHVPVCHPDVHSMPPNPQVLYTTCSSPPDSVAPGENEGDDCQSIASDSDPNPRGHAQPNPIDIRYFPTRSNFTGGQGYVQPSCYYTLAPNPYRVPTQDNVQWSPVQHPPLGPSFSDPNIYSQTNKDYPSQMTVAPLFYVSNGYPESIPPYPLGPDPVLGRLQSTHNVPPNYGKDPSPGKQSLPSCYNCGRTGHLATDCVEQNTVEKIGTGFRLKLSQTASGGKNGNG